MKDCNIKTREMFGVEYVYPDGSGSYDIFPSLIEAEEYAKDENRFSEGCIPLYIFKSVFNEERIYFNEDAKAWNYDDFSDTMVDGRLIVNSLNINPYI